MTGLRRYLLIVLFVIGIVVRPAVGRGGQIRHEEIAKGNVVRAVEYIRVAQFPEKIFDDSPRNELIDSRLAVFGLRSWTKKDPLIGHEHARARSTACIGVSRIERHPRPITVLSVRP